MSCAEARQQVSERLDGAAAPGLDEHLAECPACRRFLEAGEGLRRSLRFEAVGEVPDIAGAVRARLASDEGPPPARRRSRSTLAVAAAALAAGVMIGVNLVGVGGNGPAPVAAADLPGRVAAAQSAIQGLRAEVRLVERGWHPTVPERRFHGTLDYRAPESLALVWQDDTAYPSGEWRPNDVSLRTDGEGWVASGLPDCRSFAQPDCTRPPRERAVTGRPPFADDAPVPLELVVPVRSFATLDTAAVVGEGVVAGRPTVEVRVLAAQAGPLIDGLQPAGNLRDVHPTDEVQLSLDAERMVPLRLRVRASGDPGREAWAAQQGYEDRPGLAVLAMDVVDLVFDAPAAALFAPPSAAAGDAGFREGDPGVDLQPAVRAGFTTNRVGRIEGATPVGVWSWSDGRAWIRVQATEAWTGPGLFGGLGSLVRPRKVDGGLAYISADGRRVARHGTGIDLVVDGSVATSELLDVVASFTVPAAPLPSDWPEARSASPAEVRRAVPGALGLTVEGFERPAGRLDGAGAVLFTAGAGDRRLLLDQRPGDRVAVPTESDYETLRLRGTDARYTPRVNRLEWVEGGLVISLRGTGVTRDELLAVAEALEPS